MTESATEKSEPNQDFQRTEEFVRLETKITELEAEVVKLKERTQKAEKKAFTDHLTGLYNRCFGEEELKRQCLAKKPRQDISVALIDIDDFKIINDIGNHKMGDKYIKDTANSLKKVIRSTDLAVRWGGDEFLIIFPNSGEEQKEVITEKIKNAGKENHLRLSVGIATLKANENNKYQNVKELVDQAEKEMKSDKLESSREKLARVYS